VVSIRAGRHVLVWSYVEEEMSAVHFFILRSLDMGKVTSSPPYCTTVLRACEGLRGGVARDPV
jgi:hypothetical protein